MRVLLGMVCACALASVAGGALASGQTDSGVMLHGIYDTDTDRQADAAQPVGDVRPGEYFSITGECVTEMDSAEDVQVVLTLADGTQGPPGYRAIVATDRRYRNSTLHVRTPNMPEAANRVFEVKLFMLGDVDAEAMESCNAGAIRISAAPGSKFG